MPGHSVLENAVVRLVVELHAQGMASFDAMERAAEKRMRPMLMTARRRLSVATVLTNGQVFVTGGDNDSGALATAELYH